MTAAALETVHGPLPLPAFLPDATRAVVRALDAADLEACGVRALMVNVLHLSSSPGAEAVAHLGGVHRFMGWNKPIASDSGGFQAFSLALGSAKLGAVSKQGFTYRFDKQDKKRTLTPEKCIRKQIQLGSDILFCLDHCTHPEADLETQRQSVEHTVAWARECRETFDRTVARTHPDGPRPLLFAVVQGGENRELRRECAERLLEIGFDGYGFGGWPIDGTGRLVDTVGYVSELVGGSTPKHALGIGKPENLAAAFDLGYRMFDCALPTRDARHKRLFAFVDESSCAGNGFYEAVYLQDRRHARDGRPVDERCDCLCCARYSRAYLHHLFQVGDTLAPRLATIHNLRFYTRLLGRLTRAEASPPCAK